MAAPNVVGAPLEASVIEQLAQRSQRLSQAGIRTGTDIRYLGQKNAWVRLTSFVKIESEGVKSLAANLGPEVQIEAGTALAKRWVLQAEQRPNGQLGYGLSTDTGNGAYGSGGLGELGYRPMPGIVSATVEAHPPLGSNKSATVKIKAWNLAQLSVLDLLYFRLGFSVLLEWGHSIFLDNKGRLINGPIPVDAFKPGITKEGVLQQIVQKRLSYGHNYEGMVGFVTNYDWTQAGDGSYDCTIVITSIGNIIESLKINTQDASTSAPPSGTSTAEGASNPTQPQGTTPTTQPPAAGTPTDPTAPSADQVPPSQRKLSIQCFLT